VSSLARTSTRSEDRARCRPVGSCSLASKVVVGWPGSRRAWPTHWPRLAESRSTLGVTEVAEEEWQRQHQRGTPNSTPFSSSSATWSSDRTADSITACFRLASCRSYAATDGPPRGPHPPAILRVEGRVRAQAREEATWLSSG
jgi:hypothetical protein